MAALIIGSAGVFLLLLAFVLNLMRRLQERDPRYLLLNMIGSGMAAWYAFAGNSVPFIVLELVWCAAAAVKLIGILQKKTPAERGS
jgi:hypothetical protein